MFFPKMVLMFTIYFLGGRTVPGGFMFFLNVHPYIVGEDSHFDSFFFPDGWFNHQPVEGCPFFLDDFFPFSKRRPKQKTHLRQAAAMSYGGAARAARNAPSERVNGGASQPQRGPWKSHGPRRG